MKIKFKAYYDVVRAAFFVEDSFTESVRIPWQLLPHDLWLLISQENAVCPACKTNKIDVAMLTICDNCGHIICGDCAKFPGEDAPPFCVKCYKDLADPF
jgi:hypothetical protein